MLKNLWLTPRVFQHIPCLAALGGRLPRRRFVKLRCGRAVGAIYHIGHFDRLSDRMLEPGSLMSGLALQVAEPAEATKQNGHRAR